MQERVQGLLRKADDSTVPKTSKVLVEKRLPQKRTLVL